MPSGLIENNDGMGTGQNLASDRVEMQLHGLAVADRQHKCCAGAVLGTDRAEQIGRLRALIVRRARTRALPGPTIGKPFFCPTRISSWNHTSTGVPGVSR